MHEGHVKASLQFHLPRGCYATMLIKRLFAPSWYARPVDRSGDRSDDRAGPRPTGSADLRSRSIVQYDNDSDD